MKAQWVKAIMVVIVALFMGGCANPTISQIQQNEPQRTFTSTKPPKEVARYIELQSRSELGGGWKDIPTVVLEEHPDQTYHVAFIHHADLHIKPSGSGSVVEYRSRSHLWVCEKQLLEIIEQCVRQTGVK